MTISRPWLVVIDDNEGWRDGLVQALRSRPDAPEVAYAGPDVNIAITAALTHAGSTLALADAHQADGSASLPVVLALRAHHIPVAVVSADAEPETIRALVTASAIGYVLKSELLDSLEGLVAAASTGTLHLSPALTASLLSTAATADLSPAQRQAMQWHAAGLPLDAALRANELSDSDYAATIQTLVLALHSAPRVADRST